MSIKSFTAATILKRNKLSIIIKHQKKHAPEKGVFFYNLSIHIEVFCILQLKTVAAVPINLELVISVG